MIRNIEYLKPEDLPKVPFVLNGISSRFIRENKIIPLDMKNNVLKVVMANPEDSTTIDALSVATSADVVVYASDNKIIEDYISRFYEQETQNINRIIEDLGERGIEFLKEEEEDIGHLKDLASEAPIIRLVNMFITRAVESRASDIHVEPFEDELKVRYRIDGVLHEFSSIAGVREDVTDIVLNVKQIALKMQGEGPKRLQLSATGPCEVKAGDIAVTGDIEVLNPDLPNNTGSLAPIKVHAPEGSILNCQYPAPVNARHSASVTNGVSGCRARSRSSRSRADVDRSPMARSACD